MRSETPPAGGNVVLLAVTLSAAMAAGTALGFALAVVAPVMMSDLHLDASQFGLVQTVFFAGAAIGSPRAGRLVDRLGAVRGLQIVFLVAVVAMVGVATSQTFVSLTAFAFAAGFGNAIANPATNRLVVEAVPEGRRGALIGWKQAGVPAGAFVLSATLPGVAVTYGWRVSILAAAGGTAMIAALTLILPRAAHRGAGPPAAVRKGSGPEQGRLIGPLRLYALFMGASTSCAQTFLALYASESLGYSPPAAGLVVATMSIVGIFARVVLARASELTGGFDRYLTALGFVCAVGSALLLIGTFAGGWLGFVGAVALGLSAMAWNGVSMTTVVSLVPPESAGWAAGYVSRPFFAGLLIAPVLVGSLVDASDSYAWPWIICGVLGLLAAGWMALRGASLRSAGTRTR